MALDFGTAKSVGVPGWLKGLVGVIVAATLAADGAIAWTALHEPSHKDWFALAIQLFSSLLPLLLAALLLAFSTTGAEALRHKTSRLLLNLIPSCIPYAATTAPEFVTLGKARRSGRFNGDCQVLISYHPGDFYCRYRIVFRDVWAHSNAPVHRLTYLIMDLKVLGANMYLCVPKSQLDKSCGNGRDRSEVFREAFRHTLTGAQQAGCLVNDKVIDLELDGQELSCLVVVRSLSPTFLSESVEQLYLAQDLVAMLRSFWREQSDWFPALDGKSAAAAKA